MSESQNLHITCPKCQMHAQVKWELAGKRVRCPNQVCGAIIDVPVPATIVEAVIEPPPTAPPTIVPQRMFATPSPVPAPTPPPAPPASSKMDSVWHYIENQQTFGPVPLVYLEQRAKSGLLKASDLVWCQGEVNWVVASKVLEFPRAPSGPPPLPSREEFTSSAREEFTSSAPMPMGKPSPGKKRGSRTTSTARYRPADFNDLYMKFLMAYLTVMSTQIIVFLPQSEGISTLNTLTSIPRMILLIVLSGIFLYRAWAQIQDGRARTTPGKAVGYRFIPFFNFYWEFVAVKGLAEDIERYARAREIDIEPISPNLTLAYCIVMIVGTVLSMVIGMALGYNAGLTGDQNRINEATLIGGRIGFVLGLPTAALLLLLFKKIADASALIAEVKLSATPGAVLEKDGTVQNAVAIVTAVGAGFAVVEKMMDDGHH